jgi:hypothetical protein
MLTIQKISILLLSICFTGITTAFHHDPVPAKARPMTAAEKSLYQKIMAYRKKKGLPEIKISASLNKVAQMHAAELQADPPEGKCNMHSWTGRFGEKKCCYTDDHKKAACMWSKPSEFTSYQGDGFEIAAFNTAPNPDFLSGWQESPGHNAVIINEGIWQTHPWKAIGIGISGTYAVAWFGESADPEGDK